MAFIKYNDVQAYCAPSLDASSFSAKEREILFSAFATSVVWESTVESLAKGDRPEWLQLPDKAQSGAPSTEDTSGLKSPRASDSNCGVFAVPPSLSFESDSSTASGSVNALLDLNPEGNLSACVHKIETKLMKIKLAWPKPFADLEASYLGVVSDIKTLESRTLSLLNSVGDTSGNTNSILDQITALSVNLKQFEDHLAIVSSEWESTLQGEIGSLATMLHDLQTKVQSYEATNRQLASKLDLHERRFGHIKPFLTSLSAGRSGTAPDLSKILYRITALETSSASQRVDPCSLSASSPDLTLQVNLLESMVKDQAHQISLLENRVV